jgi:peptidoglycan/xylan/chitin deacetylase (PgdA/CDA1 family)
VNVVHIPQEHGRFSYSPIHARPVLRWPERARVALWVIPNIEHFHFNASYPGTADPGAVPDIPSYSVRDYGNRVGVWRLMDVLDKYAIRATVALNAEVAEYEPAIIQAGVERSWEWMGHGTSNSRRLPGLGEEEERSLIVETASRITAATGSRPEGWLSPGLAETPVTLDLLKEAGFKYVTNWVNDDQPYLMQTRAGSLCSLPYSMNVNDKRVIEGTGSSASELETVICDAFDTLYAEGEQSGRVMAIALHPYLTGASHRVKYLDRALDYITKHDHVWCATGGEIVSAYLHGLDVREEVPPV